MSTSGETDEVMIEFNCPHCGNHFRVKNALAGESGWCRVCNAHIVIPSPMGDEAQPELTLEQQNAELQKSLRVIGSRYSKHLHAMSAMSKENLKLKEQFDALRDIKRAFRQSEARVAEIESLNERLTQELTSQALDRGRLEERFKFADETVQRLNIELDTLRGAYDIREKELQAELRVLQQRLTDSEASAQRFQSELTRVAESLDSPDERAAMLAIELSQVQKSLDAERIAHEAAVREAAKNETLVQTLKQKKSYWKSEVLRMREEAEVAQAELVDRSALRARTDEQERRIADLSSQVEHLREALQTSQSTELRLVEEFEKQVAAHRGTADELSLQLNQLREELAVANVRAQDQEAEIIRARHELTAMASGPAGTDMRIAQLNEQLDRVNDDLKHERAETARLRAQLTDLEARSNRQDQQLASAHTERERLQSQVERLTSIEVELGLARGQQSNTESSVREAREEAQRAADSLQTLQHEHVKLKEQLDALHAQYDRADKERHSLQERLDAAQEMATKIGVLENERANLVKRFEEAQTLAAKHGADLSALQQSSAADRSDLERALRELAAIKSELAAEKTAHTAAESELRAAVLKAEYGESLNKSIQRELEDLRERGTRLAATESLLNQGLERLDASQTQVTALTSEITRLSEAFKSTEALRQQTSATAAKAPEPEPAQNEAEDVAESDWDAETGEGSEEFEEDLTLIPELIDERTKSGNDAMAEALFRFIKPD